MALLNSKKKVHYDIVLKKIYNIMTKLTKSKKDIFTHASVDFELALIQSVEEIF